MAIAQAVAEFLHSVDAGAHVAHSIATDVYSSLAPERARVPIRCSGALRAKLTEQGLATLAGRHRPPGPLGEADAAAERWLRNRQHLHAHANDTFDKAALLRTAVEQRAPHMHADTAATLRILASQAEREAQFESALASDCERSETVASYAHHISILWALRVFVDDGLATFAKHEFTDPDDDDRKLCRNRVSWEQEANVC
jgi:hypothetical protein